VSLRSRRATNLDTYGYTFIHSLLPDVAIFFSMTPIMAPKDTYITTQLRQLIYYHIDNNLLKNALFVAERLVAFDHKSAESSHLLALCHLRLGDAKSAYEYSKAGGSRGANLGCAYVFAQACLELERYKDGIGALERSKALWGERNMFGKHTQWSRQHLPDAAAITCLLAKLYHNWGGDGNVKRAASYYEESLKMNPFMWDAFTGLCDLGVKVRVENIFKMNAEMEAVMKLHSSQSDVLNGKDTTLLAMQADHTQNRPGPRPASVVNDMADPFNNVPSRGLGGGIFGGFGLFSKVNESTPSVPHNLAAGGGGIGPEAIETPTGPSAAHDVSLAPSKRAPGVLSAYPLDPPQAPLRRNRTLQGISMDTDAPPKMSRVASTRRLQRGTDLSTDSSDSVSSRPMIGIPVAGERKRTVSGQAVHSKSSQEDAGTVQQRRSVRLFNKPKPTINGGSTTATQSRELKKARPPISRIMRPGSSTAMVGRVVSGNRKPMEDTMDLDQKEQRAQAQSSASLPIPSKSSEEPAKQEEAVRALLDLFRKLGSGFFALSKYQCKDAIQILNSLPQPQRDTPWVLAQLGKAHYEQASYAEAETFYRRIRTMAPTRFEDMEVYSTILWHLKRETDLSFLAHELVDASWKSPQAWCALGNAWSLARDHEQALKCFKRATQLDPKFSYAFTLQGHEHVANEEYDKALVAYRQGLRAEARHYNALYGIARVNEKLGKYDEAFLHYQKASKINPTNAVLICCIGTVLEKQKNHRQALAYFTKATELAPRSALTRYKKARAMMALGMMREALRELTVLKDLAPDEAMVHFLLGRLHKATGNKGLAVKHFTIALNLDPKVCLLMIWIDAWMRTDELAGKSTDQGGNREPRGRRGHR
jgi:anaphase-promoting complex subunit 3